MTIRAFADKYGLSKATAYGAAQTVFPHATEERNNDYDEEELYAALMEYLKGRKEKAWKRYTKTRLDILEVETKHGWTTNI